MSGAQSPLFGAELAHTAELESDAAAELASAAEPELDAAVDDGDAERDASKT